MRILYVEDNMANVALVRRVGRGHHLINYIDGQEALNNFDADQPDLVLMDIQLAGQLTGLDVVKQLRERGFTKPVIAVTAYAMVGDRERCLAAGCDDYMAKPLQVSDLLALFAKYNSTAAAPTATTDVKQQTDQTEGEASADESPEVITGTSIPTEDIKDTKDAAPPEEESTQSDTK